MRVGLIVYGSLQTISGGYLYDRMLVEHLTRAGDTVEIISLPWRDYPRHLTDNLSTSLPRRLATSQIDLLLQDELNHPSLVVLNRRLRQHFNRPIIAIVHHLRCCEARPAWQNRLYRLIERAYLRGVDGFVVNSRTTRREVERLAGTDRPTIVAPPAGDRLQPAMTAARIEARALAPGPREIVFVGNLIPRKGLHLLLAALARLDRADWRLSVIGSLLVDSGYVRAIRRQIERAGLADRVHLLGSRPDAALADHLARGHLLAVPSLYEGFGIVYLEAMGFGLPAIATTAGAAGEIITDGETGYLAPPGDPAALAACLNDLLTSPTTLTRMSLAAHQRYLAHPTWDETTAAIRRFLTGRLAPVESSGCTTGTPPDHRGPV